MAALITLVIIVVMCVLAVKHREFPREADCMYTDRIMALEAQRTEELRRAALKAEIKEFNETVSKMIKEKKESSEELDELYVSEYSKLLQMGIYNEQDMADAKWLFNGGNLRTSGEKYVHSGQYEKDCKRRSVLSYTVPFIIGFLIPVIYFSPDGLDVFTLLFGVPLGVILGSLFALIGGAVGHSINMADGKNANTPEAELIIREQAAKRNAAIAGAVIGTGAALKNAKRGIKDVCNVDGWKEMK